MKTIVKCTYVQQKGLKIWNNNRRDVDTDKKYATQL